MTTPAEPATLLVVEDNAIDRMLLQRKLLTHRIGNPVLYAENGIEALEILRGSGRNGVERSFLVLLDLQMPKMNGLEFLAALRSDPELSETVVVVLTTSDDERDRDEANRHRVAGYLTKQDLVADFTRLTGLVRSLNVPLRFPVTNDHETGAAGASDAS